MKFYFIASYHGVPPIQYGPFLSSQEAERYMVWLDKQWRNNACGQPKFSTIWMA